MLSPRGQQFRPWPRPRPRSIGSRPRSSSAASGNGGLVLTKVVLLAWLSVIEITSFTLRSSLIGNCFLLYNSLLKLIIVEWCIDTIVTAGWVWFRDIDKFYVGPVTPVQAFIIPVRCFYNIHSCDISGLNVGLTLPDIVNIPAIRWTAKLRLSLSKVNQSQPVLTKTVLKTILVSLLNRKFMPYAYIC